MLASFIIKAIGAEILVKCGDVNVVRLTTKTPTHAKHVAAYYKDRDVSKLTTGKLAKTIRKLT